MSIVGRVQLPSGNGAKDVRIVSFINVVLRINCDPLKLYLSLSHQMHTSGLRGNVTAPILLKEQRRKVSLSYFLWNLCFSIIPKQSTLRYLIVNRLFYISPTINKSLFLILLQYFYFIFGLFLFILLFIFRGLSSVKWWFWVCFIVFSLCMKNGT